MFNKVIIVGNLTRDIEVKFTRTGLAIANTAIASTRKFKAQDGTQKEEVLFVDIAFFGRTAEIAQQYLKRGSKLLIEGRLKLDQWTDQNGQKRSKHSVTVDTMQMLDSKDSTSKPQQEHQGSAKETSAHTPTPPVENKNTAFSNEIEDEDIPF